MVIRMCVSEEGCCYGDFCMSDLSWMSGRAGVGYISFFPTDDSILQDNTERCLKVRRGSQLVSPHPSLSNFLRTP